MAIRRRKKRYTWLPMVGSIDDDNLEESVFIRDGTVGVTAGAPLRTQIIIPQPVVLDRPQEPTDLVTFTPSLSDIIGNEYVLKRLVGSVFVSYRNAATTTPPNCLVTAGFFVARADDQLPQQPVGAVTAAEVLSNYGPANLNNAREPWMWHRAWTLGNVLSTDTAVAFKNAPQTNMNYGSLREGSHVDCKSARRVTQDERLFFVISATNVDGGGATTGTVDFRIMVRALGQLRRAHNRSTF